MLEKGRRAEKSKDDPYQGGGFKLVLIGQVKRYFAYESRHQHGAIDMTGGFKYFYFQPYLGKKSNLTNIFQMG